jgi:hypothetical protein
MFHAKTAQESVKKRNDDSLVSIILAHFLFLSYLTLREV